MKKKCGIVMLMLLLLGMSKGVFASNSDIQSKMLDRLYNASGGYVSCDFDGYVNTKGRHEGIDFCNGAGKKIYSLISGEVIRVSNASSLSTCAIYDSVHNKTVLYLHGRFSISKGYVYAGQLIGVESNLGASAAHTHIEVRNGRREYAAKSVDDYTLDNDNPYPYWESIFNGGCTCSESYAGNYTCTSKSTLNIRSGHSTSSSVVGSIPNGATVYVSKSDGTWAHVEYNGVSGCVSMSYLSKKPDYVDLGENFYASIYSAANGSVVTNDFDNVSGRVYIGNDNQKWIFWRCDAENGYTLRNAADWKMLTAGYSAYVSDENNQDNQVWYIVKNDFGSYSLISKADRGTALDLAAASAEEGTNILTIESHQDWDSQKWMVEKYNLYGNATNLGEHFYARIQNNKSQTFLTAIDGDIQGYHDLQDNSQIWEFTRNGNGSYRIQSVTTGGYMQVEWNGERDGEKILCGTDTDNARRDWFIYQTGGLYFFCPSGSHIPQAMECYEGDGGIVKTWSYHEGWETQIFNINFQKPVYHLDINGVLDDIWQSNLGEYGTCDIYINGVLEADDCSDYYRTWPKGSTYEIRDIRATKCHRYNGVSEGVISGTITDDTKVSLSFSTEHSYDEGAISGNTITYKCLNCDAVTETALLTLNDEDGILVAEIAPTDKVIEQGIVYAKGGAVTLETSGRTMVVFTELTKDNTFIYETSEAEGYTYRAYAKYTNGDGEEEVAYSEMVFE